MLKMPNKVLKNMIACLPDRLIMIFLMKKRAQPKSRPGNKLGGF